MANQPVSSTQNTDENVIWEGSQSQIVNFGHFVITFIMIAAIIVLSFVLPVPLKGFVLFLLVVPIFYAVWNYLKIKFIHYKITSQRIISSTGMFSKNTEEIELYRVHDIEVFEPFLSRLFGKGTVKVITADSSTPIFYITAIPRPKDLLDKLRAAVEARRDAKSVRGIEFEQ